MSIVIFKSVKRIPFSKWTKEIFAYFLLEIIPKCEIKTEKNILRFLANDNIVAIFVQEGFYAEGEMSLIKELILKINKSHKNSSFIDIGANIGNHSVYFLKYLRMYIRSNQIQLFTQYTKANSEIYIKIKTYNLGLGNKTKRISKNK